MELTIACGTLPELTERITRGELDVAVIEVPVNETTDEYLCVGRLARVGPRGGSVHARHPPPLSMVGESCAFRTRMLKTLDEHDIEWRTVSESSNIGATTTTVRIRLVITTWLTPTIPADLDILGPEAGLPELLMFAINLLLPTQGAGATMLALAQYVHDELSSRQQVGERRAA